MTGGASITATGWGWRHAGRKRAAVADVSIDIAPGERVLLLGASGSGKSTLLAGIAGLLGGDEDGTAVGTLTVDGRDAREARGRTGLVLQDPDAAPVLSRVGDDVAFGCENLGVERDEIWRRVARSLEAVGLDVPLSRQTSQLSGGEKQRLAIAGILAMDPAVILLDEPTANLDPVGVSEVRAAIERAVLDDGTTLVVVEHRTEVWVDLMTRVIVLDAGGGVFADGPPAEVFARAGAALADAGVWVPGVSVGLPDADRPGSDDGAALSTSVLSIGRSAEAIIRSRLDVVVPMHRSTVVVGSNGVGKSTLALTLAGLLPEREGTVTASAALATRRGPRPSRWSSRDLLTRIGTVFQEPEHQFLASTVRDELAIGPRALRLGDHEVQGRVDEMLDVLGLAELARANPFTLSGGQKRRLSVGTVLIARPAVMVLDEPTFGQDRGSWIRLVALLQNLVADGGTVVSVTHDAGIVRHLGQHVIRLDDVGVPGMTEAAA